MASGEWALDRRVRWAAVAGMSGPLWFWGTLIGLALLHGRIDVSGHQLLRYGVLMYVGFLVYGSSTLFFAWGLAHRLPRRRLATAAVVALTVLGCGPLLATFTMGAEQGPPQSWHAWLHLAGFLVISLVPVLALPLFGGAVRGDARWRPLGSASVVWGVATAVVVFLPGAPAEGYAIWAGPGSLVDLALVGAWQIFISRRLRALTAEPSPQRLAAQRTAAQNTSS